MPNFLEQFLGEASERVMPVLQAPIERFGGTPIGTAFSVPLAIPSMLLRGGIEAATVLDDTISRPISTAFQATTFSNPLYRDGIQFSDFRRMWEASAYLSPGRAAMTSAFSPGTPSGTLAWALSGMGEGDWNEFAFVPGSDYNPYTMGERATEEAWDNSPLGTIGSLSADVAYQIAAGKGIGSAAKLLKRAAGLSTNVSGFRDLQKLNTTLDNHIKWAETSGAEGKRSVLGDTMMEIANSKNYSDIYSNPWLNAFTRSGSLRQMELAEILTRVDDPRLVRDILLADRGDAMAIGRLFQQAPDHVWSLSNMSSSLRAKFIEGGQWHPDANEVSLIRQTFDAPIARDEFWSAVRNSFMRAGEEGAEEGLLTGISRNADFIPMQGVAGRAQRWLYNSEMSTRLGSSGQWVDHVLGPLGRNSPTTVLLQWVGGRRPVGRVSLSGLRPTEAVDEMLSYSASSRALRGMRDVSMPLTRPDGSVGYQTVTMDVWRNSAIQRLAQAKISGGDTAVALTVRELEGELIEAIGRKYQIDPERMLAIREGVQEARDRSQREVARDGFFFDEVGNRVEPDQVTRRQLADELALIPLDELDYALRVESTTAFAKRGRGTARVLDIAETPADWVLKFWRTNMLFKPGYTPKNSIGEPAISSLIAHGTILSPDGLIPAINNFTVNRARQIRQAGYAVADRTGLSGMRRSNEEILGLHNRRMMLQKELDEELLFIERLDSGGLSPAARAAYGQTAIDSRRRIERELSDLESLLDDADPVWRDVVEIPSYGEISRRINDLDEVVNGGDEWVAATTARIESLSGQASSRMSGNISDIDKQILDAEKQIDLLKKSPRDDAAKFNSIRILEDKVSELSSRRERYLSEDFDVSGTFLTSQEVAEIARLERMLNLNARHRSGEINLADSVEALKVERASLRDELFVLEPTAFARKVDLEKRIAALDGQISAKSAKLVKRRARREKAKKRKLGGEGNWVARIGDEDIVVRGVFNEGDFGAAIRAEVSSGRTNTLTFDPSEYGSAASARWARNGGVGVVQPTDPIYWEELAYIANRQLRGDKFAEKVLEGRSVQEIVEWLKTPEGLSYARGMGWDDAATKAKIVGSRRTKLLAEEKVPRVAEDVARSGAPRQRPGYAAAMTEAQGKLRRAQEELAAARSANIGVDEAQKALQDARYEVARLRQASGPGGMPNVEVPSPGWTPAAADVGRRSEDVRIPLIEEAEIARNVRLINQYFPDPQSRARLLADEDVTPAELQKIMGGDMDALSPVHSGALTWSNEGRLRRGINNALDAIWRNMAVKPEDRFGRFPYLDRQFRENVMADARLLQEQGVEITASTVNSLRSAAVARALKDAENTFYNIRRYSNPVFALRYLVGFPGAYFNSLYRYTRLAYKNPGRAYLAANAYATVYEMFGVNSDGDKVDDWKDATAIVIPVPETAQKVVPLDDTIRLSTTTVDYISQKPTFIPITTVPVATMLKYKPQANEWIREEFGQDFYETLFPFGQPTFENKVTVGGVVLDPLFSGWELDLVTSLSPSDEDFLQAGDQLWLHRMAEWEKGGQQGPPPDPEQAMSDSSNFWFGKSALKFFGIGGISAQPEGQMWREEWYKIRELYPNDRVKAREVYLDKLGEWADYYTRSSSKYRVYVPSTVDAVNRLEEHTDLADDLRSINPDDPWLASIMFWGSEGEFDRSVYNFLGSATLPNDDVAIRGKYTPAEMADYEAAQRSWDEYNAAKARLDATMMKYGYKQLTRDGQSGWLYEQWNSWLDQFKAAPENRQWLDDFSEPDTAKTIKAINALTAVTQNNAFMSANGGYGAYQTAVAYLEQRANAVAAYDAATSSEQRQSILEQWDQYVTANLLPTSSEFAALYTRALQGKDLG
jgi:hypothetical protein